MENIIQRLKYNQTLQETKVRLEKELKMVNQEIETQQNQCDHIEIILGSTDSHLDRDTIISECLFCGKKGLPQYTPQIDAHIYKKHKYSNGEAGRFGRLKEIQDLWLQYITENPGLTEEEIIEKIREVIKEDEEKYKQLKKTLN